MIRRLRQKIQLQDFLKDNVQLFLINLIVAFFNFSLQPIASRFLRSDFDLWTSINSLAFILQTLITGITTEIIKKTASLEKVHSILSFRYYFFLRKYLVITSLSLFLLIPVLVFPVNFLIKTDNFWLSGLTLFYFFGLFTVMGGTSFLLGSLRIREYGILNILVVLVRFFCSLGFFWLGLGVVSLPAALVLASLTSLLLAEFFIRQNYIRAAQNFQQMRAEILAQEQLEQQTIETQKNLLLESKQSFVSETLEKKSKLQQIESLLNSKFSLRETIYNFVHTGLLLLTLTLIFQITASLIRTLLPGDQFVQDRNLFATLTFFGQIIYFAGFSSTLGMLAHASKSADKKIYYLSIALAFAIALLGTLSFWLTAPFLLYLLGRQEYIGQIDLILKYGLFIAFYLVVQLSVQYLIARNCKKLASTILIVLLLQVFLLFKQTEIGHWFGFSPVETLVNINLTVTCFSAFVYFLLITKSKLNLQNSDLQNSNS